MKMTTRQMKLLNFVIEQHGSQKRKYNLEPYWFHLMRVAIKADSLILLGAEIGLCHDLVEDVPGLTFADLTAKLEDIGYDRDEVDRIVLGVYHLTDVYTPEAYPDLNRKERKTLEAHRLWKIPAFAQTVKYCDLEDNTSTIVPYDTKFAATYLPEKDYILKKMDQGNPELYKQLVSSVSNHLTALACS